MENNNVQFPDNTVYTKQTRRDHSLDHAQLETRCPLDNGRFAVGSISARYLAGQLDQLPNELLVQILLQLDIPSLTQFRRVNRRAMALVDSIPKYAALIKHCPDIIRAIISVQADAFDLGTLYRTLSTSQCHTCERFGDHLYLIDCRRVCYLCFLRLPEYVPIPDGMAKHLFDPPENPPSVLALPGVYSSTWHSTLDLSRKRIRLFDRQALTGNPQSGSRINMAKMPTVRFTTIITAPYLVDAPGGPQVDWGYFCLGCKQCKGETGHGKRHFRRKYTTQGMLEHLAEYGPVKESRSNPGTFKHSSRP